VILLLGEQIYELMPEYSPINLSSNALSGEAFEGKCSGKPGFTHFFERLRNFHIPCRINRLPFFYSRSFVFIRGSNANSFCFRGVPGIFPLVRDSEFEPIFRQNHFGATPLKQSIW